MDFHGILKYFGEFFAAAHYLYWFLAIFGSLVFAIQVVLTFLGVGIDDGSDVDVSAETDLTGHPDTGFSEMKFFSMRAIFAFVTFFGWGGVLWGKTGWFGFIMACVCGLVMMFGTAFLIYALLKLQHSGGIQNKDLVGCGGTVYITIPAGMAEAGKVTVNTGSCTREISAVAEEEIPSGVSVVVESQLDGNRFVVKRV